MLFKVRFPIIFAFFSAYFAGTFVSGQNECAVTTRYGNIAGFEVDTLNPNKKVCAYLGIPYASPPVGSLRFMPPQPAIAWATTLNANAWPNWCPQPGSPPQGIEMSENCLYLNVVAPKTNATNLPVMIWIHGGAFTGGSATGINPIRMQSREDVVMVIIQYRLGTLGFLSTGDWAAPGNFGLKDQAFAIRWVNQNIQAFGGNPNQVTLFGESAGGASVMYQMITPLNKGLIHGAIAQSGTAVAFWALDKNPAESAKLMAALVGCPSFFGSAYMVTCLRNISWQVLINAQNMYTGYSWSQMTYGTATMTPVVEPNLPGAFISDEPEAILRTGDVPDIPLILGANKHDGSFILAVLYASKIGPQQLDKNAEYMKDKIVPDLLKFFRINDEFPGSRMSASSAELAYLNGVNRSSWDESMPGLVDLITVHAFKSPAENVAEILSRRNRKVYLYDFVHKSSFTYFQPNPQIPVKGGVAHADELIYLFTPTSSFNTNDQSFAELFCDLWLNFGISGNPTPKADKRFENWALYDVMDEPFFKINGAPTLQYGYRNSWRPNGFE